MPRSSCRFPGRPRLTPPAALLVAVLALAACRGSDDDLTGRAVATATEERSVALEGRTLVLDGFAGDVRVLADPTLSEVRLRAERSARGATDGSAAARLEGVTLREAGGADLYQFVWRTEHEAGTRVDVEVRVPPGTAVTLRLGAGDLVAEGLEGALDAELGAGTATATGLTASEVRLRTGSGALEVEARALPAGAAYTLETGAGEIVLALPAAASVNVEAETRAGQVRLGDLPFEGPRLTTSGGQARFRARLGRGQARVEARTGAGDVVFRETGTDADNLAP
ncbi:MAG: hypothetical protein ACK41D_11375 [Rubricoccaceae bacterium]